MLKIAPHLWTYKIGENYYVKNLYSDLTGIQKLSKKASLLFEKIKNINKIPINLYTMELILKDVLIFTRRDTNYPVPTIKNPKTFMLWLHMTNSCNLNCSYCYIKKDNKHTSINPKVIMQIAKSFKFLKKQGIKKVTIKFAGGKPLLNFEGIKKSIEIFTKDGKRSNIKVEYVILTNGTIFSQQICNLIKENNIHFTISLDVTQKFHDEYRKYKDNKQGSYNDIIQNIKKFRKYGCNIYLSTVVTPKSVQNLPQYFDFVTENNLPFTLSWVRPNPIANFTNDDTIDHFIKGLKQAYSYLETKMPIKQSLLTTLTNRANLYKAHRITCGVNHNYLSINHQGKVFQYNMLISTGKSDITVFEKDWITKGLNTYKFNIDIEEKTICKNCKWKYLCTGGCPLYTKWETGNPQNPSPNCKIYKSILPLILKLEAIRLNKLGK